MSSSRLDTRIGLSLLYMLLIPAIVPSALSAYSVVGEREQGTLEPILITPIRREEFLVGKALAALYANAGGLVHDLRDLPAGAALFAHPAIVSAVFTSSHILVQLAVHAADRRLVDLGRDRDLRPLLGRPRRSAAQRVRQLAAARDRRR